MRKHRKTKAPSARELALAACRALLPAPARRGADLRRARALARFAVAMSR